MNNEYQLLGVQLRDSEVLELERLARVLSRIGDHKRIMPTAAAMAAVMIRIAMADPALGDRLAEFLQRAA